MLGALILASRTCVRVNMGSKIGHLTRTVDLVERVTVSGV